jgi:acyl-coenzyme A thioesterase PaaI-like protein
VTEALEGAPIVTVPEDDPRRRLAAALRPIVTMTVAASFDEGVLEEAADRIEEIGRSLAAVAGPKVRRVLPDLESQVQEFFPTSPVMGLNNPLSPPLVVHVVDGPEGGHPEIRAEAWFDWAYEGPPNGVHGGVVAEVFDDVLGAATIVAGNPGMTGTLTIRYRKLTPIRTPLRIEARCLSRSGRKVKAWAGIYHGDLLTAEADGLFIEVDPARFAAVTRARRDASRPAEA